MSFLNSPFRYLRLLRYIYNFSETGFFFERSLLQRLPLIVNHFKNPIVLDYGCGTKPYYFLFHDLQPDYAGIDVYPGKHVDIVYDGIHLPFESGKFDIVFSSSVFEHVQELDLALSEIHRVLKPNGLLISVVPFMSHVHGAPFDYHRPTLFGWHHYLGKYFYNHSVFPVNNRFEAFVNTFTSFINLSIYDFMYFSSKKFIREKRSALAEGAASPESSPRIRHTLYYIMMFNPVNFLLGLVSLCLGNIFHLSPRDNGQYTTGYLLVARKHQ